MKLTKDQLKKIIQEEVANMEEYRVAGVGTIDDDEPESEEAYIRRMRRKQEFDRERFARAGTGISSAEMKAREKAAEEEEEYQRDQARKQKNLRQQQDYKQSVADDKMELINTFIKFGGEDFEKSFRANADDADTWLESWLEIAYEDIGEKPPTKAQYASVGDIKKFLKKNKYGVYKPKRSFMQKAGRFLTGKGFNEDITKEDIQKMVQEELEAVTKGN